MRAWAKRMIWFFGFSLSVDIGRYTTHLITGSRIGMTETQTLILALGLFIPLFFLKDDEPKTKKKK
jgi:hypothetical protein